MNKQSSSLHFHLPVCLNYMFFLFSHLSAVLLHYSLNSISLNTETILLLVLLVFSLLTLVERLRISNETIRLHFTYPVHLLLQQVNNLPLKDNSF